MDGLPPRAPARRRVRFRRARPAVLRLRDRRARRRRQRRGPQLRQLQRRPHRGPGPGRPADRRARRRRHRDRLGDPAQRRQLRRADPGPARHGQPTAGHPRTRRPRAGHDPSGRALRPQPARPDAGAGHRGLHRHLRAQLPDDLRADDHRGVRARTHRLRAAGHDHGGRVAGGGAPGRPPHPGTPRLRGRRRPGVRRGRDRRRPDADVPHLRAAHPAAGPERTHHDHQRQHLRAGQHRATHARAGDGALHDDLHGRHPAGLTAGRLGGGDAGSALDAHPRRSDDHPGCPRVDRAPGGRLSAAGRRPRAARAAGRATTAGGAAARRGRGGRACGRPARPGAPRR